MPYVPRPGYGGPPGHLVPVRPGQVPAGMQFMPPANVLYASPQFMHGSPGMQGNAGGPRPQMYHPGHPGVRAESLFSWLPRHPAKAVCLLCGCLS